MRDELSWNDGMTTVMPNYNCRKEMTIDGETNRMAVELSEAERAGVQEELKVLGDKIRAMKAGNADPGVIKEHVAQLKSLKAKLGDKGDEAPGKFVLKTPKGTRDYDPEAMAVRESVLRIVTEAFKRHGAETIDTPVFELREVLLGKYGEEGGKLVYDLQDQGGELLSMRYDLTVPFARYLAMTKVKNIKRYHIAKVYRRDQPNMTRGRYREFYQCDFDIAGQYDLMLPESECLKIVDEVLKKLEIEQFFIHLNHRLLLEGMFEVSGISPKLFKTVCSSVDKLDKSPWAEVENELLKDKGLNPEQTKKLGDLVRFRELNPGVSNEELIKKMRNLPELSGNAKFKKGADELEVLIKYCDLLGVDSVKFEPSLARGLDYYTGAIYEAVAPHAMDEVVETESGLPAGVGSVAAGGRYDGLVSMFNPKNNVPCCGVSFGIERLFTLVEAKLKKKSTTIRTKQTEVYVASPQKGMLAERLKLCKQLWTADIKTEFPYKANPKLLDQLQYCETHQIPLALIIGDGELEKGVVKLRVVATREEKEVPLVNLVESVRDTLKQLSSP
ncbi:hypothetical protein WR25_25084 [Diploscapter pachys]|uniref:histidine--tRNA ligase n=1 Tax=Diploscapter pachys TaxID=2018661 RepID=A0A2A2LHP8_9BILA|nr:hypothetical protein WR25_25084 [Diploscapter pachys]